MPAVNARLQVLDNSRPEDFGQALYDRVNIATTVPTSITMFSVPIGQTATLIRANATASVSKTRRDTNMEQAGFIATRAYQVNGIAFGIIHADRDSATNAQDRQYVLDGGWLKFTVAGSKTILEIPMLTIPVINDVTAVATTATSTTINAHGGPKASMFRLNPAVTLAPGTNFAIELGWDGTITLSNSLDIYLFMYAGMRRPT